ncbi:MAG TPA: segregation/condensation protein A [Blastocatellia bacterium]|nr:segregation/condensation protein A [Blastocatellia bacterium]HMV85635.1 segregation/condensation protein A [Blastocatellia bacterium]HMX29209.1 segregation/condensation protein A [Blastocatellia bacterium]HMY72145.1 segregation/condensation protein A [Blastocatellia bacterium]HMZ21524.1 segregation/condensation protein A [Blastocatellia bacterium]
MAKTQKEKAAGTALAELPEAEGEERRDSYRVKLEVFEGPMDLLLYLIKKDEIDIKDIPIAHITNQYLDYLTLMRELDIAIAGDFLVMASTLIYIKSKMLLPPAPKIAGEEDLNEDPRAELMDRLLEYQKFKEAAQMLHSRGEIEAAVYTRGQLETDKTNPEVTATVFDLLRVFREILKRAESEAEMEIHRDEVTMAEKLAQIHHLLDTNEEVNIRLLFESSRSKRELILTFLTFLELVKEMKITLLQRELFGDIFAKKRTVALTFDADGELEAEARASLQAEPVVETDAPEATIAPAEPESVVASTEEERN